jgi:hypothetical protein
MARISAMCLGLVCRSASGCSFAVGAAQFGAAMAAASSVRKWLAGSDDYRTMRVFTSIYSK